MREKKKVSFQTDRQTPDRETDRPTGRQADRQPDRQTDRDRETETYQAVKQVVCLQFLDFIETGIKRSKIKFIVNISFIFVWCQIVRGFSNTDY